MYCKLRYLFLFSCIVCLDAVNFRCDYTYHDVGWFKFHEIPLTWNYARHQCYYEGARLASPTTVSKRIIMQNAIGKVDIFTGFRDTFSNGQYYSIRRTPLFDVPHTWADSQPDNKKFTENCISLNSDGKLSNVRCDQQRPFMCYRENTRNDVNNCGTFDPEYRLNARTKKCYKFHEKSRKFHEADFVCSAEGGHLAIVNSKVEAEVLLEIYANQRYAEKYVFIGFYLDKEVNEWITVDGQSLQEAGFEEYKPGAPNNYGGNEYCGSFSDHGLLNDVNCNSPLAFICEKSYNVTPACVDQQSTKKIKLDLSRL